VNNRFLLVIISIVAVILVIYFGSKQMRETGEEHGLTEWRFALEEIQDSVQDAYAQRFKELIEEKTKGEITVTVYPYGTLGTSDQLTELVENGAVQFAMASPGHLGSIIPETQVFLLHYLFSNDPAVNNKLLAPDGELISFFGDLYRQRGLELLSFYQEGWMAWTSNKQLSTLDDFRGFKMRLMSSPILTALYRAYGASPTPLPYAEVYSALQLNMIDGQENPVFAIEEMSFYEVSDYMTFPYHAPFVTSAITNASFFAALSEERKQIVKETISELSHYIFEVQEKYNQERLEKIIERRPQLKISHLSEAQQNVFREASASVRDDIERFTGPRGPQALAIIDRELAKPADE